MRKFCLDGFNRVALNKRFLRVFLRLFEFFYDLNRSMECNGPFWDCLFMYLSRKYPSEMMMPLHIKDHFWREFHVTVEQEQNFFFSSTTTFRLYSDQFSHEQQRKLFSESLILQFKDVIKLHEIHFDYSFQKILFGV